MIYEKYCQVLGNVGYKSLITFLYAYSQQSHCFTMHIKFDKKSDAAFNKFCWHSLFDRSIKSNYTQNFITSCKLSMCQQTRFFNWWEHYPLSIGLDPSLIKCIYKGHSRSKIIMLVHNLYN